MAASHSVNANTPTSATSANKSAVGAGIKKVMLKTSSSSGLKKDGDESDGDKKEKRIGFGVARK